jgi:hypothetical protein
MFGDLKDMTSEIAMLDWLPRAIIDSCLSGCGTHYPSELPAKMPQGRPAAGEIGGGLNDWGHFIAGKKALNLIIVLNVT